MPFQAYMIVTASGERRIETVEDVAKREAKNTGGSYEPIEIPSNKGDLVIYINELLAAPQRAARQGDVKRFDNVAALMADLNDDDDDLMDDAPTPDPLPRFDAGRSCAIMDGGPEVERIAEAILKSSGYVLARFAGAVATRFADLAKR